MNKSILGIALFTLGLAGTSSATPLILPQTAVGVNKTVDLSTHVYNLNGGGVFQGTVAGNQAWMWCIDVDNFTNYDPYTANVTLLDDTWASGQNSLVNKGTASTSFANTSFTDGILGTFTPTNEQRYQAAAYLISQTAFFTSGGSNTSQAVGDQHYQNAAWRLLDSGSNNLPFDMTENGYIVAALKQVMTTTPTYGFGAWAVISGPASPSGTLGAQQYQTFIAQVQPIPEPGTYALMGAGLVGLAMFRRRRRKS
jgi:hypothetical protein